MLRDTILTLLGKSPRLETVRGHILGTIRKHIGHSSLKPIEKIGTWKCLCRHTNPVYIFPGYLHPLGMMACDREGCGLTWHPSPSPITPLQSSNLMVVVRLPDPNKPSEDNAPYILPYSKNSELQNFEDSATPGYGYVCLSEKCGLGWATKVVEEWSWGSSRKVLAVAGRRRKGSCLCGRRVQVGGGFAVFEVVRRE